MRGGVRRGLADFVCRVLQAALPSSLQAWGCAIRHETADIPDDTEALLFAVDSLLGLLPRALALQFLEAFASLIGRSVRCLEPPITMRLFDDLMRRPRAIGILCATGAVAMGLVFMEIAGAPTRFLVLNIGALVVGLMMLSLLGRAMRARRHRAGAASLAVAGALMATALLGDEVLGVARWVRLGGLAVQPSLILLPVMLVAFRARRSALATAGVIIAIAAMAMQPDRAMAGVLAASLAVLAVMRLDRHVVLAFGASLAGLAITLARSDHLPAAPFVDQILYSSFDVHIVAGMAVSGGSALILLPAIVGWRRDPEGRATYAAFGAVWCSVIVAAALGNYPTPLVGFGGSAIIGYALSLLALPKTASPHAIADAQREQTDEVPQDLQLLVGVT